ncbi:6-aminohexanoate-cyclic-dimer hydrolase [Pseudomonas fluorescens]|uniref:6-aminohexanoate-cyclic-dimer hydrolase n=1 Tax=Pseudomonas fluorescens TaxID=294 RepID=A0A5E6RLB9_PSEFL|nr:amidase [Pseudomonas fluorescens]VVM68562.1 6-aminohexanoate-cyclic-dimer hydrolase [Pseudomonas fluorescens]
MDNHESVPLNSTTDWPRRSVLKAGAVAIGVGLLGRFADARAQGLAASDYQSMDAWAMSQAIRSGELTAEDLLAAALSRYSEVNARINAVNMLHEAYARTLLAQRRSAGSHNQGPLAGVPLLFKDLNTSLQGTITSNGSRLFKDSPPAAHTSTLIARYQQAGAVPFGKTASPEFGLTTTTESLAWGQTHNPWNLAMSAGGSSGGSAAAVAAGIVPVAHATDGGGSIRIPASYCGVIGLKPSRYRTPSGPLHFEGAFGASVANVVSRTVRDTALFLDAGQGHEAGSAYWCPPLIRPYVEELQREPGKLRVAVVRQSLTGAPLEPAIAATLEQTIKQLLALGHELEELNLNVDPRQLFGAHGTALGTALRVQIHDREQVLGRAVNSDDLEKVTLVNLERFKSTSGEDLYRARQAFESISATMEQHFERFDVILSPVTGSLTPKLGLLSLDQPWDSYVHHAMGSAGFTVVANVSGQPAISLPLGQSDSGLPVGMMFTARLGGEDVLLRLASQLEQAHPWAGKRATV